MRVVLQWNATVPTPCMFIIQSAKKQVHHEKECLAKDKCGVWGYIIHGYLFLNTYYILHFLIIDNNSARISAGDHGYNWYIDVLRVLCVLSILCVMC